ncbi:MAG: hypothetical protein KAU38_12630, partial [Desulfobacterales bacterium]|nr:hypothetical protein [Desulfobacterales bacterium]
PSRAVAWKERHAPSQQFQATAREGCQKLGTPNSKLGTGSVTMEVGGIVEVMSWVMAWRLLQGFQFWSRSRNARVLPTPEEYA